MNQLRRAKNRVALSLAMKHTDTKLVNNYSTRVWSNEDMDPVPVERRNWTSWTFASYWLSESWGPTAWSVGSSLVAGGLLWWHALLACIVGHFIASLLTVWNGRGGSIYHIGFPVWMRAVFGMWGSLFPLTLRIILDVVWCGIQTWFGALFMDITLQCIFGSHWTNIPNKLPKSADITTSFMCAYFLFFLLGLTTAFFRPHQMKWLLTIKAITQPIACFGLFIFCLVRSGGPGSLALTQTKPSSAVLGWTFVAGMNAAINGEFGPLIASDSDISRYAKKPRHQLIGQLSVAPWSASVVVMLGIIAASCTFNIYGVAYWNPGEIMYAILKENSDSKTRFACFCCAFTFMIGSVGTNYVANLLPFGVDATAWAPKYMNITRGQIMCAIIGAWGIVPWKVLVSGASFLTAITGIGIFIACLLGILVGDYFFVRKGNYWIEDLYTDNPQGRYWYWHGFNWRAYAAYICGIALPFPGFVGAIGAIPSLSATLTPAAQIYSFGYLLSFAVGLVVYTTLSRVFPPGDVAEARSMPFEAMGKHDVLTGIDRHESDVENSSEVMEAKY